MKIFIWIPPYIEGVTIYNTVNRNKENSKNEKKNNQTMVKIISEFKKKNLVNAF